MNKLFTQEKLHLLSQIRALIDVAQASDTWYIINSSFWQLKEQLCENVLFDVEFCDCQFTYREGILAYWYRLWHRLNDLYKGMREVSYLNNERAQLEEAIGRNS